MAAPKRGKLAYKFVVFFLLVSLVPISIVGFKLISISQSSLKSQMLRNQESDAIGFANTVWTYITSYKNILLESAHQEEFVNPGSDARASAARQGQYLVRIMQNHAAFLELSVLNLSGQEILRKGRFLDPDRPPPMRSFSPEGDPQVKLPLQGQEFIGSLERFQGLYPTLTLAVPIADGRVQPPRTIGILMAKISLNGLSQMLNQQFPEMLNQQFPEAGRREAAVVSPDGFLVAHSNPKVVFRQDAKLPKEITDVILTQTVDNGGGEIALPGGKKLLGAFASVRDLAWVVYTQEPLESAYEVVGEMQSKTIQVLAAVVILVLVVSFLLAGYVTRPIRVLREAAQALGEGQFEEAPEIVMTNDEIGDLAQSFLQMAESLREKTGELVHAKEELEKFTKFLERRVEARTRELKAAQDELIKKERLAAIGQMASVVGHEIRNPLAVINNSTYFIKTKLSADGMQLDPKIAKHLAIIESEIKQANGIINEILTFSRMRALKPGVVSINSFLEEILSVHPFPSHIRVVKELDPRNPVVNIDADEMRQAVRNLIGNGVEVMPQGGTLRVATEIVQDRWVRVDVGDSGPGIPPDILEKIFAPFFTTKARGTGLGLAVVRKVVDRHQGKVDVESVVGKGAVFKIFLPLASRATVEAEAGVPRTGA